jgi:fatty acid desaturase
MLRYKADIRTLIFVGLYFATAVLSWVYFPSTWWGILLVVAANSVLSFICAVIVHNTIHAPIFRKKELNKAFQVILSFTYGHSVSAYVPGHNFSHHRYTQTTKDRIRTDKMRFKINFFNQLFFFFRMAPGIVQDENRFAMIMRKEKPQWFRQYVFELALVLGVKIALLILDPWKAIAILFIPHLYAAWGVVGTNYWQHDGCDENHKYNHSRNFSNPILNFLCFNNGYHGAHHEKPNLHWSLLPAYHEQHIAPYIHPNLNLNSLTVFLWKTHIWPGKRVDYLGNPVVLPPKKKDQNWIKGLDVDADPEHVSLGVEG